MRISTQCLVIFNCYIYCLNIYIFCFILLFTSSSLCRKDQFAVSYFSTSLIVLIQVYNWEIRQWFVAVDLLTFYILYRSVSLVLSFVSNYYVFAFWGLLLYFPPDISTSPLFLGGGGNTSPPSDPKNSSSMGEISSACVDEWRDESGNVGGDIKFLCVFPLLSNLQMQSQT